MLCRKLFTHGFPQGLLTATLGVALLAGGLATQARAQGRSGATLQADKTLDICLEQDGNWTYTGVVSVWNTGTNDATGCQIFDKIESKDSGPTFTQQYVALNNISCGNLSGILPGGTTQSQAFATSYSVTAAPLSGTIRNNAQVTISNHSGGNTNGPNPKFTYTGSIPPPACPDEGGCGCALSQGYWKTHQEDWPSTADLDVFDANSDGSGVEEALAILNTNGSDANYGPWIIVAKQYIAYLLNVASGTCTPAGLQPSVDNMENFFADPTHTPAACVPIKGGKGVTANPNPCSAPLAQSCFLDQYNNGLYLDGPSHCGGVEDGDPLVCSTP
jgi:hypothetical protein